MNIENTFRFKELDFEGMATLESIADASLFNEWMYEVTSQRLSGRILEIGSGIGNISEFYLRDNRQIMLSDIRDNYCEYLQSRFDSTSACEGVLRLDLVHPNFDKEYAEYLDSFDGIFALNVVEHIQNDEIAIANAYKLLKKNGRLVILVPAYQSLYNNFDKALEHYRRYTEGSLKALFKNSQFEITHSQYFNLAAISGWWFSGSVLKNDIIPKGHMKIYNTLVPVFKILDKLVFNRVGISVIVEGVK